MTPEALLELQVTLRLAIDAISRHDKTIESSALVLQGLVKSLVIVETRLEDIESVDFSQVEYEVKAMKASALAAQRRMDGLSIGLAIAVITAIFSVISSLVVLQLSKPAPTAVTQTK